MNIFENTDAFYGNLDKAVAEDALLSFFRLAKQIRLRLGKKGYLLDNYLALIFEELDNRLTFDAVDEGGTAFEDFLVLLSHMVEGEEPEKPYPLYERVREIYERHICPLVFQEPYTKVCLLILLMSDEWMSFALSEFVRKKEQFFVGAEDTIYLRELYNEICRLAGESLMEELNRQLKQRFQIASKRAAFAQGFTDKLISQLIWRDRETSRQIFQLLLDFIPENGKCEADGWL